jgi:hypothetical protein
MGDYAAPALPPIVDAGDLLTRTDASISPVCGGAIKRLAGELLRRTCLLDIVG